MSVTCETIGMPRVRPSSAIAAITSGGNLVSVIQILMKSTRCALRLRTFARASEGGVGLSVGAPFQERFDFVLQVSGQLQLKHAFDKAFRVARARAESFSPQRLNRSDRLMARRRAHMADSAWGCQS